MSDRPIVCTLTPIDLQRRREHLLPGLIQRAEACDVLENGVRLRYAPSSEVLADIVKMIDAERQCCRFLRFELNVAPDLGPIALEVTGPPGTAEFLAELIDRAEQEPQMTQIVWLRNRNATRNRRRITGRSGRPGRSR